MGRTIPQKQAVEVGESSYFRRGIQFPHLATVPRNSHFFLFFNAKVGTLIGLGWLYAQ